MADRIRISRRRVMQLGLAAPLIALEAKGACPEEIEAAAAKLALVQFPDKKLQEFKGKAKKYCEDTRCDCFDDAKYGTIAMLLWNQFCGGVAAREAKVPESGTKLEQLLDAAYAATSPETKGAKSGELIASRLKDWGSLHEDPTNHCAYLCGLYAADYAGTGKKVKPDHYQAAFERTSKEMKGMIARIIAQGGTGRIRGGGC